jgi:hypothetical protein
MKIVRRKMKQGGTTGRHMIITRENKQGVFARYIGEDYEFWLAENLNNFEEMKVINCNISIIEFNALKHAVFFYHIWAPRWKTIYENEPDVIRFYAKNQGFLYIWPNLIKKRVLNKAPMVYIEIESRCYEPDDKQQD